MKSVLTLVVAATVTAALAAYGQRADWALGVPPADKDVLIDRSRGNEGECGSWCARPFSRPSAVAGPLAQGSVRSRLTRPAVTTAAEGHRGMRQHRGLRRET